MNQENPVPENLLLQQLQHLIRAIEASGRAILPDTNLALLQSTVKSANRIFDATATAIALVTDDGQELEFIVAYNIINQDIIGMRFPAHSGIAGYVTMTGQPLAVSQVEEDPRFNREVAEQSGYIPRHILAVPLVSGEDVFGVIEVLDKVNGESFTLQDIEHLSLLADQAALAVVQSKQFSQLHKFLLAGLKDLAGVGDGDEAAELLSALDEQPPAGDDLVELAQMIKDVSALGERERDACRQILHVFQEYSRDQPPAQFGTGFRL
ncbi:MAG: GAF domain-containing protein [Candidatus Promineifilaceae bacterium]|nr:GAF domain-containing protein [Candidatus Promineifilaceae bacterium]